MQRATSFVKNLDVITVVIALVVVAAFVAKVKWGTYGFSRGR